MKENEVTFIGRHIKPEYSVLEVGSGASTTEFAERTRKVVSLEHHERWYKRVKNNLAKFDNVEYVLRKPNKKWRKYKTDGSYDSFKDYIDYLSSLKDEHFDLIFIDGRARRDCLLAIGAHHPDAIFFLHDFYLDEEVLKKNPSRRGYLDLLETFEIVELVDTLVMLRYKGSQ